MVADVVDGPLTDALGDVHFLVDPVVHLTFEDARRCDGECLIKNQPLCFGFGFGDVTSGPVHTEFEP